MQIFVTGGSGFVGRHLIAALRNQGHTVRALARSESAASIVREAGAAPVMGDLGDVAVLETGMTGCAAVIHSAAYVEDWGSEEAFYRINVRGTEHVLEAARRAAVLRLIHISTEAVLVGGPPIVGADENWPYPAHPLGLYPLTKGLAEARVRAANSPELETVVLRPRLVWGVGDTTILPGLAKAVRSGTFTWIEGGHYLTSTCHVANTCEGILAALARGRGGEVYFLTDGPPVEFRAFATALLQTQEMTPGTRSIPRWLARVVAWGGEMVWSSFRRPGSPPLTQTSLRLIGEEVTVKDEKARRELGYTAHMSWEAGLATLRGTSFSP